MKEVANAEIAAAKLFELPVETQVFEIGEKVVVVVEYVAIETDGCDG